MQGEGERGSEIVNHLWMSFLPHSESFLCGSMVFP